MTGRAGGGSARGGAGPAAHPKTRMVASHEAHYWFLARKLLEALDPRAPPVRGNRRKRELQNQLKAVLLPVHPEAVAASSTLVGQICFAHAVEVLGILLNIDVPPTPFSGTLTSAATADEDGQDVDPAALHALLSREAADALQRAGLVRRWRR